MSEKQDEIRLKELFGVFCTETYKELIGILKRDQERYHKEQVKKLNIDDVSKRSELLKFMDWHYEEDIADQKTKEAIVDTYLK